MTDTRERHGYEDIQETAAAITARYGRTPDVAIVLGSGLGGMAESFRDPMVIPYEELPHFPLPKVPGHAGNLVLGRVNGHTAVAMQGRVHYYEGWPLATVVFPVRVMRALGARALVVTNAAGVLHDTLEPGDLMAITDHINLMGDNPLIGENDQRLGLRFPDMSTAYSARLTEVFLRVAREEGIPLHRGIYAGVRGPSYETPAEVRMLRMLGADAVGMSTVPEVIAAVHMGFEVCAISCITNLAAGIAKGPLNHEEVEETAASARDSLTTLLSKAIPRLTVSPKQ